MSVLSLCQHFCRPRSVLLFNESTEAGLHWPGFYTVDTTTPGNASLLPVSSLAFQWTPSPLSPLPLPLSLTPLRKVEPGWGSTDNTHTFTTISTYYHHHTINTTILSSHNHNYHHTTITIITLSPLRQVAPGWGSTDGSAAS